MMGSEHAALLRHQHHGERCQRAEQEAGRERQQRAVVILADRGADADPEQGGDCAVKRRSGAGDLALRLHRQCCEVRHYQPEREHHQD
ncbi:hypothetical protein chiPu_0028878 [Chiloscyllium punctatum]|uniref:Uncharacterized protein n=1 Tax=Chiloscyllium punctatum TaxID=137246 RepID=A0A401TQX6_CHIPU|nr:hypothetical protein [Chiloscyllium punctatum]